jgi:hypothetical protein
VKYYFLLTLYFGLLHFCNAQELVVLKNTPSDGLTQKFSVSEFNKKVKQGSFILLLAERIVLAKGDYNLDKKTSIWEYNDFFGKLEQKYDYTRHKLLYSKPPDTKFVRVGVDSTIKATDALVYPVKIGGNNFCGYYSIINNSPVDKFAEISHINKRSYFILRMLNIGADGIVKSLQLFAVGKNFKYSYNIPLTDLSEEDKLFVPALLNGKPIASQVYLRLGAKRFDTNIYALY